MYKLLKDDNHKRMECEKYPLTSFPILSFPYLKYSSVTKN